MVKNTIVALIAAASIAGAAVPAFASPVIAAETTDVDTAFGSGSTEMRDFTANMVLTQLQQSGVNATSVEDWSGLIRAYVTLEDGSQVMKFYRPGSLTEVIL